MGLLPLFLLRAATRLKAPGLLCEKSNFSSSPPLPPDSQIHRVIFMNPAIFSRCLTGLVHSQKAEIQIWTGEHQFVPVWTSESQPRASLTKQSSRSHSRASVCGCSHPCCLARLPQLTAELQRMLIQSPSLCWHTNELR